MNVVKAKLFAAVATVCLLWLGQPLLAQSNCKEAKGNLSEIFLPNVNSNTGTLSNAGWLNGTTLSVFDPALFPLPAIVIWTGQFTITTSQGQLKASTVTIATFQTLPAKASVVGTIDPAGSTGIFAGATGTLFINGFETNPQTFQSEVHGRVCFAK